MAVKNFIPELWSEKILRDLDKSQMLVAHCTKKWSGEITGVGSKVHIQAIKDPTVKDYVPGVTSINAEELQDESTMLEITEAKYFAFSLNDVDKKQAKGGLMKEGMHKATQKLKDTSEQFIAGKYTEAGNTVTEDALTSQNVYSTLLKAKELLLENNVSESTKVYLEVAPAIYSKIKLAEIVNTDTGKAIHGGKYSDVLDLEIYVSNNLKKTGDVNHCIMRTGEAIAYAEQIMKVEKYRPHDSFKDAVKGLHVYGAKVIQPKQMVRLDLTVAEETTI